MTSNLYFWAIKHLPSGEYLKLARSKSGTAATIGGWGPPRLFIKKQYASVALKWWLKGCISVTTTSDWEGEYDEVWYTEKMPERVAAEMKVVRLEIKEKVDV